MSELLKLDKSYMSRIIRSFENSGIVHRKVSESDKRTICISLTESGKSEVNKLIEITNQHIENAIDTLDSETCQQICNAMNLITEKLGKERE